MKLLALSFVLAIVLLSLTSGCTVALAYLTNRPAIEYECKVLDSLKRLPQFSNVYRTIDITNMRSRADFQFSYTLHFECNAGYQQYSSLPEMKALKADLYTHVLDSSVFEGVCFNYDHPGGNAPNVCLKYLELPEGVTQKAIQ
jgi:hypothetical protein